MTIYTLIPVHNRIELTLQFLDSLDAQTTHESVQVFIVDDGSTDNTATILRRRNGRFPTTVIPGNGKLWWAGSIKRGLKVIRPRLTPADWLYLGNNDTILDPNHLQSLLTTAANNPQSLVGSVSCEIWPDGTKHPVSSGFKIDPRKLTVTGLDGHTTDVQEADALAGRGLLIPAEAATHLRFHPHLIPQHFADLAATSKLKKLGFHLLVDPHAQSTQTDRAASAQEWGQTLTLSWNKRDPLFVPAVATFWLTASTPGELLGAFPVVLKRMRRSSSATSS